MNKHFTRVEHFGSASNPKRDLSHRAFHHQFAEHGGCIEKAVHAARACVVSDWFWGYPWRLEVWRSNAPHWASTRLLFVVLLPGLARYIPLSRGGGWGGGSLTMAPFYVFLPSWSVYCPCAKAYTSAYRRRAKPFDVCLHCRAPLCFAQV